MHITGFFSIVGSCNLTSAIPLPATSRKGTQPQFMAPQWEQLSPLHHAAQLEDAQHKHSVDNCCSDGHIGHLIHFVSRILCNFTCDGEVMKMALSPSHVHKQLFVGQHICICHAAIEGEKPFALPNPTTALSTMLSDFSKKSEPLNPKLGQ